MKEKVILAYSGGLDTTAIIPWLKENYDYDVVCCCIDVGQGNELDGLEERAKYSGAEKLYILDVVDEFVDMKEKYETATDSNGFNLEALDLLLKHKVVTIESVETLLEKDKLQIENIDSVLEKYKGE